MSPSQQNLKKAQRDNARTTRRKAGTSANEPGSEIGPAPGKTRVAGALTASTHTFALTISARHCPAWPNNFLNRSDNLVSEINA